MSLASAAEIRPVGIDDLSPVRSIHASSFRMLASGDLGEKEIAALADHAHSAEYTDHLIEQASAQRLLGAWIDGELAGTAAWSPADDTGRTARIMEVFVRPLFMGGGLGSRLTLEAEAAARRAGFDAFQVRSPMNAAPFFRRLGYEPTSAGTHTVLVDISIPVIFMRKSAGAAS